MMPSNEETFGVSNDDKPESAFSERFSESNFVYQFNMSYTSSNKHQRTVENLDTTSPFALR